MIVNIQLMGHHLHLSPVVDEESMRPMDEHNAVSFLLLSHCRVGGRKGFQSVKTNVSLIPRSFFLELEDEENQEGTSNPRFAWKTSVEMELVRR